MNMKRGMSSLIAIVLILGFTIVLTVLIFTYSTVLLKDTIGATQEKIDFECNQVNFRIKEGCYTDENVSLLIENLEGYDLNAGFAARLYYDNNVTNIPTFPDIKIEAYSTETVSLFFSGLNKETRIELISKIKENDKVIFCGDNSDFFMIKECE